MNEQSEPENEETTPVEDGSPCLQGERVTFTGRLASMTHREAQDLVEQHGGQSMTHVSRQTTMLVVGEEGWPLESDGSPALKFQEVQTKLEEGISIRILNESDWLYLLGMREKRQEAQRQYTPAMLSQLLNVSVGTIRSWERAKLIKPIKKISRLPYFDFQEVKSARKLVELLAAGVSRRELEKSLLLLDHILPDVSQPLAQLEILARDARLVYRDDQGLLDPSGQRHLNFEDENQEAPPSSAPSLKLPSRETNAESQVTNWFEEGCHQVDEGEFEKATDAFRKALQQFPGDPEINFHLAETLYRMGNSPAALERYYAAVETDPNYLEAWTQLGVLQVEQENWQGAQEAFEIALTVHPEYLDAHWQIANVLEQLGRLPEAITHWKTYLEFEERGPWAEAARQKLERWSEM